jgi:methylated-DNA-[protein]-cysteine S-methyltransferase
MSDIERALRSVRPEAGEVDRAVAGLLRRAERAGLVDVAYASVDSPFGPLVVATTARGLVRLAYPDRNLDEILLDLATRLSPRILEAPGRTDEVRRELDEYFAGHRRRFETPLDWALSRGFGRRVLRAAARIPFGTVRTYRDVASTAGNDRAYRAAGNALGANPIPVVVPCHRVVHTDGGLGGYTGGIERKEFLLELEGVVTG